MHTKPATPEDAELVYSIKVAAYAEHAIRARGNWDETFQRAYTQKNLPHTRLIYEGAETIGWIAWEENDSNLELIDVHILPAYQRKGVGSSLLVQLVNRADAVQKPIGLGVLKVNPSRSLYERFGFRTVGSTETHILMKRGPQSSPQRL